MKTFFKSLIPQTVDHTVLSLKHFRILTHLSTVMMCMSSYDMENYQMYVNVAMTQWNKIAKTDNAGPLIEQLEQENIIEVNNKYSAGSFSKAYRYTVHHWDAIKNKDYNTELLMPFKPHTLKYGKFVQKTFSDEILQKCCNNYENVSIDADWYELLKYGPDTVKYVDYDKYHMCLPYVNQIASGNITTMKRDSARLYHPLICMNKKIRGSIKVNGKQPRYIDVKSCHPALLLYFYNDAQWKELVTNGDVYAAINPDPVKYKREHIKEYFQQAISYYKDGKMSCIARQIREKLKQFKIWNALEILFKRCEQEDTTVQMILQQLEASIFVDYLNASDEWMLPMHDGLMVEENFDLEALQTFAYNKLGFKLVMTIV